MQLPHKIPSQHARRRHGKLFRAPCFVEIALLDITPEAFSTRQHLQLYCGKQRVAKFPHAICRRYRFPGIMAERYVVEERQRASTNDQEHAECPY